MEGCKPFHLLTSESSYMGRRCQGCGILLEVSGENGMIIMPGMLPLYFHYGCAMNAVRMNIPDELKFAAYILAFWYRDAGKREECHLS